MSATPQDPKTGCAQTERVAELVMRALSAGEASALEAHVQQCAERYPRVQRNRLHVRARHVLPRHHRVIS